MLPCHEDEAAVAQPIRRVPVGGVGEDFEKVEARGAG